MCHLFWQTDCLPQTSPICQAFCAEQETADFELAVDSHTKISVATASVGSFKFWLILWSDCAAVQWIGSIHWSGRKCLSGFFPLVGSFPPYQQADLCLSAAVWLLLWFGEEAQGSKGGTVLLLKVCTHSFKGNVQLHSVNSYSKS